MEMNTLFTPVDVDEETGDVLYKMDEGYLLEDVIEGLKYNNAYLPPIDHVVFNTKTEEWIEDPGKEGDKPTKVKVQLENPVLATIVYFCDGTKVTVKNCDKDQITLVDEKVKLSDGTETTVRTASRESREIGLAYAVLKRVFCYYDENGNVNGGSLSKLMNELIDDARCQDVDAAKAAAEKRISKERAKEKPAEPKDEKVRSPFQSMTDKLAEVTRNLAKLTAELASLKEGQDEK